MKYFLFGNTKVCVDEGQFTLVSNNSTNLFVTSQDNVDITYHFIESDFLFMKEYELIEHTGGYEIYNSNHGYFIVYHWRSLTYAFGYFLTDIIKQDSVIVYTNRKLNDEHELYYSKILGDLSMHIRFLRNSQAILHCSYVCIDQEAILFLGPCGTGKSTQADLWKKYAGATIINGDRALIGKIGDKWYAFGYPACGSSNICKNITLPIKAFVILEKADYNSVEQISFSKKVTSLVAGMQIYPWMTEEMDLLFNFCLQLVQQNKIFKLKCTISQDAVEAVQKKLEE